MLGPVLFGSRPMEVTDMIHVTRGEEVHTFIDMVMNMEGINQKSHLSDGILMLR
jgi:hypothetical protein